MRTRFPSMVRSLPLLAMLLLAGGLPAQRIDWRARGDFFVDNTEFFTPYRVGETIFGARLSTWLEATTGPRTALHLGVAADRRWGSRDFTDSVKPIVAFRYATPHTTAILGTLDARRRHGLLDPVMVSTRELTSPVEYGGQWREARRFVTSDLWLHWQQLNTPTQREGFEMGAVVAFHPMPHLDIDVQHLWSHRGGQLYDAGVDVSNNRVTAFGVRFGDSLRTLGAVRLSAHRLVNSGHLEPPPGDTRPEHGSGTLLRASVAPGAIAEVFVQHWRGMDFDAAAGDANYGSRGHAAGFYRTERRYTEIGFVRRAEIESGITLDLEARWHRIDREKSIAFFGTPWELSYRLVVSVPVGGVVRE